MAILQRGGPGPRGHPPPAGIGWAGDRRTLGDKSAPVIGRLLTPPPPDPDPHCRTTPTRTRLVTGDWLSQHLGTPGLAIVESDEDVLL